MKKFYVVTSLTYKKEDVKMSSVMRLDDKDVERIKETYGLEEIELESNPDLILKVNTLQNTVNLLLESNPDLISKVDALQNTVDSLTVSLAELKKEGE